MSASGLTLAEQLHAKKERLNELRQYAADLRYIQKAGLKTPGLGEIADRIDQLAWGVGVYYPDGQ